MARSFGASLDMLYDMLNYIRREAQLQGFDPFRISQIELASEEALVNIVSYGYPDCDGIIKIDCSKPGRNIQGIKITIQDKGIPYNPLTSSHRAIPYPFKGMFLKPGGYGIFFILRIMDEVEYTRDRDTNILILIKYL